MGRISRGETTLATSTPPATRAAEVITKTAPAQPVAGRIANQQSPLTEPFLSQVDKDRQAWDKLSFGQKLWGTLREIPRVLYEFIPPSIREVNERATKEGRAVGIGEGARAALKGGAEFLAQIPEVISEAIGGGILAVPQAITGKDEQLTIPGFKGAGEFVSRLGAENLGEQITQLGTISSWQLQKKQLEEQGFGSEEAAALVGINAYLGITPLATAGLKSKPGKALKEKITTKEVPIAETAPALKAKAVAEAGGKEAIIPEGTARVERPAVTKTKEALGKAPEQKQFHDLLEGHMDEFFEGREKLLSFEDPLNKALGKLDDKELATYSNLTQGLVSVDKPTPNLKTAIDLWRETNKNIEADLIARGKLTAEQVENRRWKPVETLTGIGREELKRSGVEPIYYPYLSEELLKKSDFLGTTGKRTKGGYLKRFTGKMLAEDSYIKNPKIGIPRHRVQVFRDAMNSKFVDDIRTSFAEKDPALIKIYEENPRFAEEMGVTEWKPSGSLRFFPVVEKGVKTGVGVTKRVEKYWLPKTVAKELDRFYKPGFIEKTLRMTYDPLIDMWRVSVLNLVPRWLYNNFVGNNVLYTLGKGDPLALLFKAPKELFARTKLGEKLGLEKRELPKGVLAKEFAGGELPKAGKLGGLPSEQTQFLRPLDNWLNLLEQAKRYPALRIPAATTQGIIKGWIALGKPIGHLNKVVENWFRTALYISKSEGKFMGLQLDKPVPPAEGLRYVNEFLFDYSKLSRAERATFRRALPFWNWMKNIAAFSFKFPANHPVRAAVVQALLQDYVDYINETNQADDKVKSVLRIKTDLTEDGKPIYINVRSAIPFSDVFNTIPTNFRKVGRFLTSNPVSKIIIERGFKINSFTGQPFTQPKELQTLDAFGRPVLPVPSLARHVGQQIPQVGIAEKVVDYLKYGAPLKRYETGEPKIFRGRLQPSDMFIEIFKYFGLNLSPFEYNQLQNSVDRKERKAEVKKGIYEKTVERLLEKGVY